MPDKMIMVVDDDIQIGNFLEEVLTAEGFDVIRAYSGTEALLCMEHKRPDLVLLDLMLPGLSGEQILPRLQGIPVIVLSAKSGIDDKVNLLLGGAVDYMTKPFATKELLARITVALRKAEGHPAGEMLTYKELCLEQNTRAVTLAGQPVSLTKTEYAILKLMMSAPGQVFAKSIILDRIAQDTPDCTESSLKTHISHLRTKLREAGGQEYIEAVWGIGFKMA